MYTHMQMGTPLVSETRLVSSQGIPLDQFRRPQSMRWIGCIKHTQTQLNMQEVFIKTLVDNTSQQIRRQDQETARHLVGRTRVDVVPQRLSITPMVNV